MKNLKNLGSILTKTEQKTILGGNAFCWGSCTGNNDGWSCCAPGNTRGECSNGVCIEL